MQINVNVDLSGWQLKTLREEKRLAYNLSEALNNTAKAFQLAMRNAISEKFHLRDDPQKTRRFLLQQILIKPFASPKKGVMYVEISVAQKARLLLAAYEAGERRQGFVGRDSAVPNPATAREGGQFGGVIKTEVRFKNLRLKPFTVHSLTRPDTVQYKGKDRTFQLGSTAMNPAGGVYQRVGPKPDDIRLLYSYKTAFKLKAILDFLSTAEITMNERFKIEWILANARTPSK